jgi:ATP-dependent protease Clp ATPase subunit
MKTADKPDPSGGPEISCSFCGAAESQVNKLIAGDAATICDRCIVAAVDQIVRHATQAKSRSGRFRAGSLPCSFCHEAASLHNALVGSTHARVCESCLSAILVALASDLAEREDETLVLMMGDPQLP